MPWSSNASIIERGAAAPPITTRRSVESRLPVFARWSSRPNQIVGTPAEKVTRSRSSCSYRLAPSSLAPGITMPTPTSGQA